MITGFFLVVLTWCVMFSAVSLLGYPLAFVLNGRQRGSITLRSSMWIGTLVGIIAILVIGVFFPLKSVAALAIFVGLLTIAATASVFMFRRKTGSTFAPINISMSTWIFIAALTLALAYLALAALGPVTNYDSGLYHLGAIKYAAEYSTIPGLANLYFPFGYNTSLYPVGAFMGNGPWNGNGFRLVNGFLILMLVVDLILRLTKRSRGNRKISTGSYFLIIATPLSLIPLVSLSDYWVTSPSSDAPVLVFTLISVAYLLDTLTGKRHAHLNASVSFIAAVVAFSLRPTMVVFLITLSIVLLYRLFRIQRLRKVQLFLPATLGLLLFVIQSVRDYLLSGWLQYPLSLISFNSPWLAADPVWNRDATLGNARNSLDIWGSVEGFSWMGPYLARLPSQWETYFVACSGIIVIFLLGMNRRADRSPRWKTIALSLLPISAGLVTWFFLSPPSFRFGWGVIFSFSFVLIVFLLKSLVGDEQSFSDSAPSIRILQKTLSPGLSLLLVALVAFNVSVRFQGVTIIEPNTWRLGPIGISYSLSPITPAPVVQQRLDSGLMVIVPTDSDQCWDNYPLCSPIVIPSLSFRGDEIQQGFLP